MLGLFFKLCTLAYICLSTLVTTSAQQKTCDLKLKVFSYDELVSPKKRLINVSVHLKGEGTEQKSDLTDVSSVGFMNLKEGRYKLEFQKSGYKKRSKQVELDCDLADDKDSVFNFTYLWRDKKSPADDADLVVEVNGEAGTKSDAKIRSASSDEKIFGKVNIKVLIDEDGNVISASRIDGDSKLADRAMKTARQAKFAPTLIKGEPYQVTGTLTYNFVP